MNASKSFSLGSTRGGEKQKARPSSQGAAAGRTRGPRGEGHGACTSGALPAASTTPPGGPLTLARLVSRDALRAQSLVHDVEHLPAQVENEQRQRPQRHCGEVERSRPGVLRRREGRRVASSPRQPRGRRLPVEGPPLRGTETAALGFPEARSRGRMLFPAGRAGLRENEEVGRGGVNEGQSAKKGEEEALLPPPHSQPPRGKMALAARVPSAAERFACRLHRRASRTG